MRDYPVLIPYQIDFQTTTVGKHIKQTKRHVIWRFGFAHVPSLLNNQTGVTCRGYELEVHLIWSVASGKHVLYMNNILVYQTAPGSSSVTNKIISIPSQKFDQAIYVPEHILPGGHTIHIIAWALGFGSHTTTDKQFILSFDGQSYNHFCPIYLLGSPWMMKKHNVALKKGKNKLDTTRTNSDSGSMSGSASLGGRSDPSGQHADSLSSSRQQPGVDLGDRPRRKGNPYQDQHQQKQRQDANAWHRERNNMQLPPRATTSSQTHYPMNGHGHISGTSNYQERRPSAPNVHPPDLLSGDVAKSDEEERMFIAQARVNSFRDMEEQEVQVQSGIYAKNKQEQDNFIARAKVNSFRDMRGDDDDMTVPTFARPPASNPSSNHNHNSIHRRTNYHHPNPLHLQSVQEGSDLLDIDNMHGLGPGLVRSASNLTLDTAIKTPEDDLMSLASGYSHLDPNQNWKTQQNISFRLQRPPVYADTGAGDLIQPSPSFTTHSFHGNTSVSSSAQGGIGAQSLPFQPMNFAGRHMGYYNAPNPNANINNNTQQYHQQQQQQQYQQQHSAHQAQTQYATTPSQQSSYAPSPMRPSMSSDVSFTVAPPPTFESLNAAFSSTAGNMSQGQQQVRQYY